MHTYGFMACTQAHDIVLNLERFLYGSVSIKRTFALLLCTCDAGEQ